MPVNVDTLIYGYIFLCLSLMFFDLYYIYRASKNDKKLQRKLYEYRQIISSEMRRIDRSARYEKTDGKQEKDDESIQDALKSEHSRFLTRRLRNSSNMQAFLQCMDEAADRTPESARRYMEYYYIVFQELAVVWLRKDHMHRAFFAYVIANHPPCKGDRFYPILEIMISYMNDSTVYCRENVMKAVYSIGNVNAVENALQYMNDQGIFHHQKLLSDGLMTFSGDKRELAEALWSNFGKWEDYLMVPIVVFITGCSDGFKERFYGVVASESAGLEVRIACLRYFRKNRFYRMRILICDMLTNSGKYNDNLVIVAAAVAEAYPGQDTIDALKKAMCSRKWYIRYNAASSFIKMDHSGKDEEEILNGKDRFAKEMLEYMMEEMTA